MRAGRLPIMLAMLGLAGGGALVLGPLFLSSKGEYPTGLCLSVPMAFNTHIVQGCLNRSDVDALTGEPISLGQNADDSGVVLTDPGNVNAQRMVRNCRDYDSATKAGWYALTTYDMTLESFFKRTCGVLNFLASGRPAGRSFLGPPAEGFGNADRVSAAALAPILPESGRLTVGDLVRSGSVSIQAEEPMRLVVSANGMVGDLNEVARGDFDGDGIADILAFLAVRAQNGTFRSYEVLVLSRKDPNKPLEVTRSLGGTEAAPKS